MTLLTDRLNPKHARFMRLFADLVSAAICAVLAYLTLDATIGSIVDNAIYRGNFDINRAVIWWVMPFGFFLLLLQFLRESWNGFVNIRAHRGIAESDTPQPIVPTSTAGY